MPSLTLDPSPQPRPRPPRCATGVGRPYRAEIVATARVLVEGTTLPCREVAERIGIRRETVDRWVRRFGWRRPDGEPRQAAPSLVAVPGVPGRHPGRYGAERREAARGLVENTRLSWERIGLQLGIAPCTLWRWRRRYRWTRPPGPDPKPPFHARSRTRRGRPYAADALGNAQRLVTASRLSQATIAVKVGVSGGTLSNWIARRGWTRPPDVTASRSGAVARRAGRTGTTGARRTRSCPPEIVAAAGELFPQTNLPAALIAARVGINKNTVWLWAKTHGWTRPRDLPDPHGLVRRRRRRAGA